MVTFEIHLSINETQLSSNVVQTVVQIFTVASPVILYCYSTYTFEYCIVTE